MDVLAAGNPPTRIGSILEPPITNEWVAYTHYWSHLLDSPPCLLSTDDTKILGEDERGMEENGRLELLLYQEPEQLWWHRWLRGRTAERIANRAQCSVLVARRPHWPLRRILLILRGHESDEAAIQWVGRLAVSTQAQLFVLPIVPAAPNLYRHGNIPLPPEILLAPNTYSGQQLHRLLALSKQWGLRTLLLLRATPPAERIRWAILQSRCNLVIISKEPGDWFHRWFFGTLTGLLLRGLERPVLLAHECGSRLQLHA